MPPPPTSTASTTTWAWQVSCTSSSIPRVVYLE
jgi:hypothetical protein